MSTATAGLKVKIGDQIPSVGLRATDGYLLNLRSLVGKQPVILLFFGGPPTLKGTRASAATRLPRRSRRPTRG